MYHSLEQHNSFHCVFKWGRQFSCPVYIMSFFFFLLRFKLIKLGYTNIDALEPCEMLAKQALAKNIYKEWFKAYMCRDKLPIDDGMYLIWC